MTPDIEIDAVAVSPAERDHFRVFGFVVLRQALTPPTLTALQEEAARIVPDAVGSRYLHHDDNPDGGITGHYVPATCELTPVSLSLAQRFASLAERLLDGPVLLALAQHVVFLDAASWHSDTGWAAPSLKVAAYLDPLDATNGALRVLPASHALPERRYPYYGSHFRKVAPRRWVEQLERLGAFDAAAAEERNYTGSAAH